MSAPVAWTAADGADADFTLLQRLVERARHRNLGSSGVGPYRNGVVVAQRAMTAQLAKDDGAPQSTSVGSDVIAASVSNAAGEASAGAGTGAGAGALRSGAEASGPVSVGTAAAAAADAERSSTPSRGGGGAHDESLAVAAAEAVAGGWGADTAWHVEMLNDTGRNTAFCSAVSAAVRVAAARVGHAPTVLDIGAGGTALLAITAARAGAAAPVTAVEADPLLARCARAVVTGAGLETGAVEVVSCHSMRLCVADDVVETVTEEAGRYLRGPAGEGCGADSASPASPSADGEAGEDARSPSHTLGAKVEVLVAELFDDRLLGECILPTFRAAIDELGHKAAAVTGGDSCEPEAVEAGAAATTATAGPTGGGGPGARALGPGAMAGETAPCVVTVPATASIHAVLVCSDTLASMCAPPAGGEHVASLPPVDAIEPIRLGSLPDLHFVSRPWKALGVNFSDPQLEDCVECDVTVGGVDADEADAATASAAADSSEVRIDAVAFWWRAVLWGPAERAGSKTADSDAPICISSVDPTGHWQQCVWLLQEPIFARPGDTLRVTSWYSMDQLFFHVEPVDEPTSETLAPGESGGSRVAPGFDGGELTDADSDSDADEHEPGKAPEVDGVAQPSDEDEDEFEPDGLAQCTTDRARIAMLANKHRAELIMRAVQDTVPPAAGCIVCAGGGSGLCVEAARGSHLDSGAVVVALEWDEAHKAAVSAALSAAEDDATVVTACSVGDIVGTITSTFSQVGSSTVGALVSEPYFVPLAETWSKAHALLWWWAVHKVRAAGLLDGPVWPARGALRGQLVRFGRLYDATRPVCAAGGVDVRSFNALRRRDETVATYAVARHDHEVLSQPFTLLDFDFGAEPPRRLAVAEAGVEVEVEALHGGPSSQANAVVLWVDYRLPGTSCVLTTGPGSAGWGQGVVFLPTAIPVDGVRVYGHLDTLTGDLAVRCE